MAEKKMETSTFHCEEFKTTFPFASAVEIVEMVSELEVQEDGGNEASNKSKEPRGLLLKMLDNLDSDVERLRKNAMDLEDKRETLLGSLDLIRQSHALETISDAEKKEIEEYIETITSRCRTVQIKVDTVRDQQQEESLHSVNSLIDSMVLNLRLDPMGTRGRCLAYLRSFCRCEDDNEILVSIASKLQPMHVDKGFESALLGCTLDDQKLVKRRLRGLLSYIISPQNE
ncbi:BAG family molecular chaperone regulator 2 [Cloeon dipterum]|uniref:BAG family molecular chaperone regulator 2 n=1 Tax=Cloeon dipterum TaxID=197152 RepID=UPI00321F9548